MKNREDDIAYFVAFCIEAYKNAHSMSGAEAARLLADHGILSYLSENYDVLHTQSIPWLLAEIDELISQSPEGFHPG